MNFRTTYILFGVLAAFLALFGLAMFLGPGTPPDETLVLPSVKDPAAPVQVGDIETVTIERREPRDETITLVYDQDSKQWRMTKPYELRVDSTAVTHLVEQVLNAQQQRADTSS